MRKFYILFSFFFVSYCILIGAYLINALSALPPESLGGPADPNFFMSPEQVEKAHTYSRIRNLIFFIGTPLQWAGYLLILGLGLSARYRNAAHSLFRISFVQVAFFLVLITLTTTLISFPLDYYTFKLRHLFGITTQPLADWVFDRVKSLGISILISTPIVWLLYYTIKKNPAKWWFRFWIASIPISLFLMFIQPVIIDPVFHKFTPLRDEQLKEEILELAKLADIPSNQVYEVDMSKKTNALNAYVNGIGPSTRIVLWDTTLQKMKNDEILFIMAHEMGHYVLNHMAWLFAGTTMMIFAALYILYRIYNRVVHKYGSYWGVKGPTDIASLPIILLTISVLTFLSMPIQNAVSRHSERAADEYAIKLTQNSDAAVRAFQRLAVEGLSEVNPPKLVKYIIYGHPTLYERINYVKDYDN